MKCLDCDKNYIKKNDDRFGNFEYFICEKCGNIVLSKEAYYYIEKIEQDKRYKTKILEDLSKDELISLITNNLSNIDPKSSTLECASCGKTSDAKYYYICDRCNEIEIGEN